MSKAIKLDILNRFSGSVQFTAEIKCAEDAPRSIKLGLAVRWGVMTGADLTRANLTGADLTWANLTQANLTGADLTRANLTWADLTRANLTGANLTRANLTGADLTGANLSWANLTWADLTRANLTGANLTGANLSWANLTWADLTGANLSWADLTRANLRLIGGRSDGYIFYLIREPGEGRLMIRAGFRYLTIPDARTHWASTRAGTPLGEESLALCDHAERLAKIAGWLS